MIRLNKLKCMVKIFLINKTFDVRPRSPLLLLIDSASVQLIQWKPTKLWYDYTSSDLLSFWSLTYFGFYDYGRFSFIFKKEVGLLLLRNFSGLLEYLKEATESSWNSYTPKLLGYRLLESKVKKSYPVIYWPLDLAFDYTFYILSFFISL